MKNNYDDLEELRRDLEDIIYSATQLDGNGLSMNWHDGKHPHNISIRLFDTTFMITHGRIYCITYNLCDPDSIPKIIDAVEQLLLDSSQKLPESKPFSQFNTAFM